MGETGSDISPTITTDPDLPTQESSLSSEETLSLLSRLLDSKLDKKFADFMRGLEQKELATNTEIKKLKIEAKASGTFQFKDKSPPGWTAVEEYQSDELADDSEDEKKLRSAERRTLTKLRVRKQNRSTAQLLKFSQEASLVAGSSLHRSASQPFRPQQFPQQPFRPQSFRSRQPQPSDKCFACGQFGHWANSPFAQTTAALTTTEPRHAWPALPSTSSGTLSRLGTDEYFNAVVDPYSQSAGIDERDLPECSYEDYLECSESVIVKGRLRINVKFWESIGASQFILGVIKEGYKIPFYYTPTPVYLQNNKSALQNSDFVLSAITEILKVGSVMECIVPPVVINPLSVSIQPNGKKRLILDLRHINFFVKKSKIKFEHAKSFLQCLLARPCAWACTFDVKSGYHHIKIFVSDQQFLGFAWVFEGITKYFQFTVIPFGLSVGPYIFSEVMRPLGKYWRSKAISIVVYLDDGISAAQSFSKCEEYSLVVRSDLFQSRFVPNKDKCQWVPIQVICWLGIFWDFKNNSMFIPLEEISEIFDEEVKIMSCKSVSARNLARVTGRIISNFFYHE